jgi:hypothetical protein
LSFYQETLAPSRFSPDTKLVQRYRCYLADSMVIILEGSNNRFDRLGISDIVERLSRSQAHIFNAAFEGFDLNCDLFSFVAWPGNDFYGGARSTDDGVKTAASKAMAVMTGSRGNTIPT